MEGLVVACGGCGNGAMGSDEIGRVAACLAVEGRWDSPGQRESFAELDTRRFPPQHQFTNVPISPAV